MADLTDQFRRNVRMFYAWVGSIVVLGAAPVAANWLIEQHTTASRAAGVVVGVLGFVPWLALILATVRNAAEYVRRIHLISIAIAATFGLFMLIAVGWLDRASFIDPPDFTVLWVSWMVVWVIALLGTKRYFERAQ